MLKWMIILASLVYLADSFVAAQEVPMVSDDPKVDKPLNTEMFDFISKTLGAGKMAPHLNCTLKTRSSRELRKFSGGDQWVEVLEFAGSPLLFAVNHVILTLVKLLNFDFSVLSFFWWR